MAVLVEHSSASAAKSLVQCSLFGDVQEVADVHSGAILPAFEVGGEIVGQELLPDKYQYRAAYSGEGFLCSGG